MGEGGRLVSIKFSTYYSIGGGGGGGGGGVQVTRKPLWICSRSLYRYMHATTMYRSMTVTLILGVHLLPAKKNRTKFKSQLAKVFTR